MGSFREEWRSHPRTLMGTILHKEKPKGMNQSPPQSPEGNLMAEIIALVEAEHRPRLPPPSSPKVEPPPPHQTCQDQSKAHIHKQTREHPAYQPGTRAHASPTSTWTGEGTVLCHRRRAPTSARRQTRSWLRPAPPPPPSPAPACRPRCFVPACLELPCPMTTARPCHLLLTGK
jgi:hypothetical protein